MRRGHGARILMAAATFAGCSDRTPAVGAHPDAGASSQEAGGAVDASPASHDGGPEDAGRGVDARDARGDGAGDAGSKTPCATRITYGAAWIHGPSHPSSEDVVSSEVTWDGACVTEGTSSYALLSNGWKPYFEGASACVLALDYTGACADVPAACTTRVSYGAAWQPPAGHTASYDDVGGRVFSDGLCTNAGSSSFADLSNGWQPHFTGANACALSFEYRQCGGLYTNPVIPTDCPDPGVLRDGDEYVLSCTSGDAANAYPIYSSPDLATWTARGYIFPSGHWPAWAVSDFWAPEIHKVGKGYVAYFSARDADGMLSVGVASATSPLGPFTDIGAPLVHDASMGHIDASEITAPDGTPYALWKDDGNAIGEPTPIHAQQLTPDGLALVGAPVTLITNDQTWEGPVTEAPFMVLEGGEYYLFYSGNVYSTTSYAVGVAKATSPLGPFVKATGPILVTGGAWAGPGHCAVVDTGAGDNTYMVYAAWEASAVGGGPGRLVLSDTISWTGAWPAVPLAPSSTTRPLP